LISKRKEEHVDICLNSETDAFYNHWDDVMLWHCPVPSVDLDKVELRTKAFGRTLRAPIVISAMTGGYPKARTINERLASAAAEFGIGMGVGSQRPALEPKGDKASYALLRDHDIPLKISNIGLPQIIDQGKKKALTPEQGENAMDMCGADIMAIHMNYLQEMVQPGGDTKAAGAWDAIGRFARAMPVLAKETGAGISREAALRLKRAGVKGIDVGGMSGTSFAAVEVFRAKRSGDERLSRLGETFWNWGIPTPVSVVEAQVGLPVIATGGLRTGLDVARALSLGATLGGFAKRLLPAATTGRKEVEQELGLIISELTTAMFLTGCKCVSDLPKVRKVYLDRTYDILRQIGGP